MAKEIVKEPHKKASWTCNYGEKQGGRDIKENILCCLQLDKNEKLTDLRNLFMCFIGNNSYINPGSKKIC